MTTLDLLWIATGLGGLSCLLAGIAALRPRPAGDPALHDAVADLAHDVGALRAALADELGRSRMEGGQDARHLREEIGAQTTRLGEALLSASIRTGAVQAEKVETVAAGIRTLTDATELRLAAMRRDAHEGGDALRAEVVRQIGALSEMLGQTLDAGSRAQAERLAAGAAAQTERLDGVSEGIRRLVQSNAEATESLRRTVEERLDAMRTDNATKLEEMRRTVDEKLQGTLEERLGEKFKIVSHHLEQVHTSVGEMRALATGVGDLKRVLTNVKSRGTWAEVSLGSLLDQALTAEQFARNVETVAGSGERVEFAVRLPGAGRPSGTGGLPGTGDGGSVWLPIDAKFPIEDYERLLDASDRGDVAAVEAALKGLETRIRQEGQKICRKYVAPPGTTDFAVMYLPTEGLYAEVLRRPGLVDHLQAECRIMVAGPTNLHAFLTSLRMGFRTLAIEQRSSEVWRTLGAVKTEFAKYGEVMDAVKKKLGEATNQLDRVAVRSRAIERRLRDVEAVPGTQSADLLARPPGGEARDLLDAAE